MKFGSWGDDVVFGTVGFLREWRALDLLAKVLVVLTGSSRSRMLVVGGGPSITEVKRLRDGSRIDDVFTRKSRTTRFPVTWLKWM
jgi:hypothetical protein